MKKYQIHHAPYNEPSSLEASLSVESYKKPFNSSEDARLIYDFIMQLPNGTVQSLISMIEVNLEEIRGRPARDSSPATAGSPSE